MSLALIIHICVEYISRIKLLDDRIYICLAFIDISNQLSRMVILIHALSSSV